MSKLTIAQMCANGRAIRLLREHNNQGVSLAARVSVKAVDVKEYFINAINIGIEYNDHVVGLRKAQEKADLIAAIEADAAAKIAALK